MHGTMMHIISYHIVKVYAFVLVIIGKYFDAHEHAICMRSRLKSWNVSMMQCVSLFILYLT